MKPTAFLATVLLTLSLLTGCTAEPAASAPSAPDPTVPTSTAVAATSGSGAATTIAESGVSATTTTTVWELDPLDTTGSLRVTTTRKTTATTAATGTQTTQKSAHTTARTISLPAVGSDLDGKGRIQIAAAALEGDTVVLTLRNVTSMWTTDEETYLDYVCYDAAGRELGRDSLYCGAIGAGKQRACRFTVSPQTAKVMVVKFTTTYWTEWKK